MDLNSLIMEAESNSEGWITHGPWGGPDGKPWIWMPKGNIKKITIIHEEFIEAIKFQSDDCTGETESPFYGSPWANSMENMISVNYPNEYFVSISGTYGKYDINSGMVIKSLCFVTNKKRYGPYGLGTAGTPFSYDGRGGAIVGFHGRVDAYPNAIGVYVMPGSLVFGRNSTRDHRSTHEVCSSCMSRMVMPKEMGPFGALGKYWDDGVFSIVKQIHVFMDESLKVLRATQFVYVKRDSKLFLSSMHGGTSKDKLELAALVNLDGTDEYLTRISGFYGPVGGFNGLEAITSITFHTNKTIYGPYGVESGDRYTYFTSTESRGKVVGFYGRECNGLLSAIGVHMEYI